MRKHKLGIYEKALPANISWAERFAIAKQSGYDFVEMSIDETDHRLARLEMSAQQRLEIVQAIHHSGITIPSICLSAHRRFPFGSSDPAIQEKAKLIMSQAIQLAVDLGVRTIQLAGYDVYYEESTPETVARFAAGLQWAVSLAASNQVTLAVEIMDTQFMSSISRWLEWHKLINNPWFTVYPDIGNLSAWNEQVLEELQLGMPYISAIHLKDTYKVTPQSPGQFRDVPFGDGCVDFVAFFKELQRLDYRGALLIEMWSEKASDPVAEIVKARQWIEQQMKLGGFTC